MKKYGTKLACLVVLASLAVFLTAATCQASGFAIYEWGSKGNALAGNMTGATDAEVIAYNPAALATMDKFKSSGGVVFIAPSGTLHTKDIYTGKTTSTDEDEMYHPIPHFYVGGPVWEKTGLSRLSFGLGVYSRFGLATSFPEDWPGRYNSTLAEITSLSATPTLGVKISDAWSMSFGLEMMWFSLDLQQKIDATRMLAKAGMLPALQAMGLPTTLNDPSTSLLDVKQKLTGRSLGFGVTLGVQYKPSQRLAFSFTYRSQVTQNVDGTVEYDPSPTARSLMPNNFYTTGVHGSITLPDSFTAGVMFKPLPKLTLGFTAVYTRWSSYDALTITYDKPTLGVYSTSSKKDWGDVWRFSFAVQWDALDWLDLYFSYIYDQSPVSGEYADYLLPTNDRNTLGIGAGIKFGKSWRLDVNYTYLMQDDRTYDQNQQLTKGVLNGSATDSIAHIAGVTLNYTF